MTIENSKPDIACKSSYTDISNSLFGEIHENLFKTLENKLVGDTPKNILVVGPGTDVLPYANQWDRTKKVLNGGNIILSDYNAEISRKIPRNLYRAGITDYKLLFEQEFDPKILDSVQIRTEDVSYGIKLSDESLDAIDMTFSVHHATPYVENVDSIVASAYKSLKKGGVLHFGEGDVDMKYSAKKIDKIKSDFKELVGRDYIFDDARSVGRINSLESDNSFLYALDRHKRKINNTISIDLEGCVSITADVRGKTLRNLFQDKGYSSIIHSKNKIQFPLIDKDNEKDQAGLIEPVNEYYDAALSILKTDLSSDAFTSASSALYDERQNAGKGLVEYYSHPTVLFESMRKNGFDVQNIQYDTRGPFVNIVGVKPE